MPRILFLTTDMPRDGETGGQIASWRALKAYTTFAEVDVLGLVPAGAVAPPELRAVASRVATVPIPAFYYRSARARLLATLARSQLGGRPYRLAKFDKPRARAIVAEWSAEARYDMVHCDHLATTPYADCVPGAPFVLYDHDVESHALETIAAARRSPLSRAVLRREARRTRAAELDALRRAARVLAVSEDDARLLAEIAPQLAGKVVFCPVPVPEVRPVERRPHDGPVLLALGPLHAGGRLEGLRWFLANVWPSFRGQHPRARLAVVGAGAPPDVHRRNGRDGIEVRGFVEELDEVLSEVDVCVMPLLAGGGIRVKVLELLPRGVPCVGSRLAVRGFVGVEGVHEANAPAEWLAVLGAVASSPERFRQSAIVGARQLRDRFSPEVTAGVLRDTFEEACARA